MRALGWDVEEELGPDITAPVVLESLEEAWREVRGGKSDDEDEGKDDMDLGEAAVSWRGAPMVARPAARPRLDEALALSLLKAMYNAARDSMGVGKRQLVAAFKDERRRARPDYAAAAASSGAEITLGDDEVDNDNADPYTFDLNAYATCVAAVSCARDAAALEVFGRKLGEQTLAAVRGVASASVDLGKGLAVVSTSSCVCDILDAVRGIGFAAEEVFPPDVVLRVDGMHCSHCSEAIGGGNQRRTEREKVPQQLPEYFGNNQTVSTRRYQSGNTILNAKMYLELLELLLLLLLLLLLYVFITHL